VTSKASAWAGTAAFLVLAPGTMAVLVPWLLTQWHGSPAGIDALDVLGGAMVAAGAAVVVACFARFAGEGHGTPAPVAPTEQLVIGGIYRHVRNPMYVGVAAAIAGQAVIFRNAGLVVWLVVFLLAVVGFVKLYEEPTLRDQFGASYDAYRAAVPGWIPRLRPWRG